MIETFAKYKPELVSAKALENCGFLNYNIRYPDNPEPLNSPFYQTRNSLEDNCCRKLQEPGVLIRIKAPKKMGKTSFLYRIIDHAKKQSYKTVYLNFSLIEKDKFKQYDKFLLSFYNYLNNELDGEYPWNNNEPNMLNCTYQVRSLLKKIKGVLVLILDEADQLFEYPEIYENFFPMLRVWNEKVNESEIWENLRIIVSHSTQNYGKLDINQSPFNIGYPINLEELTQEQVRNLILSHGLNSDIVNPIMSLVGGHPYLVRLACYYLACEEMTLEQFIREATTDLGIYQQHLRESLGIIKINYELTKTFQAILNASQGIETKDLEKEHIYQLDSMGLIKQTNKNVITLSCSLYKHYFSNHL